jgi:hypothetical protein
MRNDRSEYENRLRLSLAEQLLRDAEARLDAERREEEAKERQELVRRKMELKYIKDHLDRENEEERIKRAEERLRMEWELQREREDRAREVVKREAGEKKTEKAEQEKTQTNAKFDRLE